MLRSDLLGQLWEYEIRAYACNVRDTQRRDNFSHNNNNNNNNNVGISIRSMRIRRGRPCYLLRLLTSQHKIAYLQDGCKDGSTQDPLLGGLPFTRLKLDTAIDQPEVHGSEETRFFQSTRPNGSRGDRQSLTGGEGHLYTARGLHSGGSYYLLRHY
jgi:hypothetical protein